MEEQNNASSAADHDSSMRSRSAKMLQAASPYLDSSAKQTLEVFVRITDFMEIMQSMQQQGPMNYISKLIHPFSQGVSTANIKHPSPSSDVENAIRSIRPYCNQQEISLIDRILNFLNIRKYMQMYQMMQGMMSDSNVTNTDSNAFSSLFGQSAPDMANIQKMAQVFQAMNNMNSTTPPSDSSYPSMNPPDCDNTKETIVSDSNTVEPDFYDFDTDTPLSAWEEGPEYYEPQLKAAEAKTNSTSFTSSNTSKNNNTGKSSKPVRNNNTVKNKNNSKDNNLKNQQMLDLLSTMIPPDQKNTFEAMKILIESGLLKAK